MNRDSPTPICSVGMPLDFGTLISSGIVNCMVCGFGKSYCVRNFLAEKGL